jgi:hypothetical protein
MQETASLRSSVQREWMKIAVLDYSIQTLFFSFLCVRVRILHIDKGKKLFIFYVYFLFVVKYLQYYQT